VTRFDGGDLELGRFKCAVCAGEKSGSYEKEANSGGERNIALSDGSDMRRKSIAGQRVGERGGGIEAK
jgi:hypothetical protein